MLSMNINAEKFLAITAALAVGVVVGCSSSDKNSGTGDKDGGAGGSTASSSGGKTSTGGVAATGGKASTGGAANKDGGAGGTANKDASVGDSGTGGTVTACLGDDAVPFVDAGAEGFDACAILPYYNDFCQPDAGAEGYQPIGISVCQLMDGVLRPAAFAEFRTCLAGLTNGCAVSHEAAVVACYDNVFARTCEKPKVDGGTDPCAAVAPCSGVTPKECHDALRSFTDDSLTNDILLCLDGITAWDASATCAEDFWSCVYVPR
jgi:hypothetical protein